MTTPVSSVDLEVYLPQDLVLPDKLEVGDIFSFSTSDEHKYLTAKKHLYDVSDLFQVNTVATFTGHSYIIGFHRIDSKGMPSGNYPKYTMERHRKLRVFKCLTEEERQALKYTKILNKIKELNKRYDERKLRSKKGEVPQVQPNG